MTPKKQQASLRRRKNKQKARRLAHAKLMATVRAGLKRTKADANVRMVRRNGGGVALGMRIGLLGHSREVVVQVPEEKLVGAVEDTQEMGEIILQVGLLTLGSLLNFNLAEGPEELAKALARWAGIDLEALKAAAEADKGVTTEVDEDGDVIVRTATSDALAAPDAVPDGLPAPANQAEEPETPAQSTTSD